LTTVARTAFNCVMNANHHMLVVEDDPVGRQTLTAYLRKEGHRISEAANGDDMRRLFARGDVDVVLLDINLPGEDGLSLLRELRRQSEVGVIMVTARHDSVDRIVALELGADDYVTKPYNMRELLPRAKNLARRVAAARLRSPDEPKKTFGGWTLDIPHWTLTSPAGEELRLTRAEFELLATLVVNRGRVCTRDSLIDHVSHRGHDPLDRTIDVLVGRLRRKIEDDPTKPRRIITVHGVGYMFAS
jgi:two-component system torCAD operon response regulator TorR